MTTQKDQVSSPRFAIIAPDGEPELVDKAIKKFEADLRWRGPSGQPQNFVLLPRDQAEALYEHIICRGQCPRP